MDKGGLDCKSITRVLSLQVLCAFYSVSFQGATTTSLPSTNDSPQFPTRST